MNHINYANTNRYNCSGCTSCKSVCPKQCIQMMEDKEGFLYPKVDISLCSNCGACVKACPWMGEKPQKTDGFPKVYAAKNTSDEVRMVSTSGGIFTAIARYVLSKEGVVYGAAFVPLTQNVEHVSVTSETELNRLRGSKYVQSALGNSFTEIRKLLGEGKNVLFTGTPCQCSGLRAFLKKDYEGLFIVDILCHSTPSPKVFKDALISSGGTVDDIRFRDKSLGWRNSYHFEMFKGGSSITNDTYLTMFFKGLTNRPSCYNCIFTSTIRPSDITIGDYWNIKAVKPEFEDALGVSCILVNSRKGEELLKSISGYLNLFETDLKPAIQVCMSRNVKEPSLREAFWGEYVTKGYRYCSKKYGHTTSWERFRDLKLAPIVRKIKMIIKHGR